MQEFEAKTCPEQYLLDKVEGLHRQRDQLREALEAHRDNLRDLLDDEECAPVVRLYFDREDLYHMNAALKATEEG